jgi:hypothetical protein
VRVAASQSSVTHDVTQNINIHDTTNEHHANAGRTGTLDWGRNVNVYTDIKFEVMYNIIAATVSAAAISTLAS